MKFKVGEKIGRMVYQSKTTGERKAYSNVVVEEVKSDRFVGVKEDGTYGTFIFDGIKRIA